MEEVNFSKDGFFRSCMVKYRAPDPKAMIRVSSAGKMVTVRRSVQRLTLLLPVEEQTRKLEVGDGHVCMDDCHG